MENQHGKGSLVVGSVLLGALVGATIGVLFAPHKGSKTRKSIGNALKSTAKNVKEDVEEEGQYLKNKALQFGNNIDHTIDKVSSDVKDKTADVLKS